MDELSIISGGTAAVGAGWFAKELFGPTVKALGEQLRVYLHGRVAAIFNRGAQIAEQEGLVLNSVQPGLLARMIMSASFSSESDEITDWWANLFLEASLAESNRSAVHADMMALIGPVEATCLRDFFNTFSFAQKGQFYQQSQSISSSVETLLEAAAGHWLGELPVTSQTIFQLRNNMLRGEVQWPLRPISWAFPFQSEEGAVTLSNQGNPWYVENVLSIGILERAGILQTSKATVVKGELTAWVKAIAMTPLGLDFYRACTGADRPVP